MKTFLQIGEEMGDPKDDLFMSRHLLNLKNVDLPKKNQAHQNVSVNLKEEIRFKKEAGRICIVGELPASKQGLGRAPMVAAALLIIFALNLGQLLFLGRNKTQEALVLASEAFGSLQEAGTSFITGEEGAENVFFKQAQDLFAEAEDKADFLLSHSSPWIQEPGKVESLRNIIEAGELMTEIGHQMSEARVALTNLPKEGSITDHIRTVSEQYLEPAALSFAQVNENLDQVDLSGTGYEQNLMEYRTKLNALSDLFELWVSAKEPLLTALGADLPQHYLILFQNNSEMRGGGGFIGSFALVEFNDGRMTNFEFKDVYELDNSYYEHLPVPDPELSALTPEWRLRDSNTSVDFPTSAKQAMHLLSIEGEQSVDGVIAVNLSAAQAFIEETGPLQIPSLGQPLTSETMPAVLSTLVEAKAAGKNSPKLFLEELIHSFLTAIQDPETKIALGSAALDEIYKKQILMYHKNPEVQDLLTSLDMDAAIPDLNTLEDDFVLTKMTNTGANKTDAYMQTNFLHDTRVLSDGSLVHTLSIQRSNQFSQQTLAWIKEVAARYGFTAWNPDLERVLGNDINRTGLRIYLPDGAKILTVTGDALKDDLQYIHDPSMGRSYYFLNQVTPQGKTSTLNIQYTIPWKLQGSFPEYHFQFFKQPGLRNVEFKKTFQAENDILLSSEPTPSGFSDSTDYLWEGPLQKDLEFKLLYR